MDDVLGLIPTTRSVLVCLGAAVVSLDSSCDEMADVGATKLDVFEATRATRFFSTADGFVFSFTAAVILFGESAILVIVDNFVRLVAGLTLDGGVFGAVVFLLFGLAL